MLFRSARPTRTMAILSFSMLQHHNQNTKTITTNLPLIKIWPLRIRFEQVVEPRERKDPLILPEESHSLHVPALWDGRVRTNHFEREEETVHRCKFYYWLYSVLFVFCCIVFVFCCIVLQWQTNLFPNELYGITVAKG